MCFALVRSGVGSFYTRHKSRPGVAVTPGYNAAARGRAGGTPEPRRRDSHQDVWPSERVAAHRAETGSIRQGPGYKSEYSRAQPGDEHTRGRRGAKALYKPT